MGRKRKERKGLGKENEGKKRKERRWKETETENMICWENTEKST